MRYRAGWSSWTYLHFGNVEIHVTASRAFGLISKKTRGQEWTQFTLRIFHHPLNSISVGTMTRPKGRFVTDPNAPRPPGVRPVGRPRKEAPKPRVATGRGPGRPRKTETQDIQPIRRSSRLSTVDGDNPTIVGPGEQSSAKRKERHEPSLPTLQGEASQRRATVIDEIAETDEEDFVRPSKRRPAVDKSKTASSHFDGGDVFGDEESEFQNSIINPMEARNCRGEETSIESSNINSIEPREDGDEDINFEDSVIDPMELREGGDEDIDFEDSIINPMDPRIDSDEYNRSQSRDSSISFDLSAKPKAFPRPPSYEMFSIDADNAIFKSPEEPIDATWSAVEHKQLECCGDSDGRFHLWKMMLHIFHATPYDLFTWGLTVSPSLTPDDTEDIWKSISELLPHPMWNGQLYCLRFFLQMAVCLRIPSHLEPIGTAKDPQDRLETEDVRRYSSYEIWQQNRPDKSLTGEHLISEMRKQTRDPQPNKTVGEAESTYFFLERIDVVTIRKALDALQSHIFDQTVQAHYIGYMIATEESWNAMKPNSLSDMIEWDRTCIIKNKRNRLLVKPDLPSAEIERHQVLELWRYTLHDGRYQSLLFPIYGKSVIDSTNTAIRDGSISNTSNTGVLECSNISNTSGSKYSNISSRGVSNSNISNILLPSEHTGLSEAINVDYEDHISKQETDGTSGLRNEINKVAVSHNAKAHKTTKDVSISHNAKTAVAQERIREASVHVKIEYDSEMEG
ncbi:hypothetical protein HD806DRAFT_549645 [Xylariaceae sp. AK1471]|nr:hypothetical protein HD806DRAFT_549645 [Xylariaceae sp. AK1471]